MRWSSHKKPRDVTVWRSRFAYRPRKIDDTWIWLEWYYERGKPWGGLGADGIDWEYSLCDNQPAEPAAIYLVALPILAMGLYLGWRLGYWFMQAVMTGV